MRTVLFLGLTSIARGLGWEANKDTIFIFIAALLFAIISDIYETFFKGQNK